MQEDMKAFVMENWSPALQAAFGDDWREHFQPKADAVRGDAQGGASSSHLFEGLVSRLDAKREVTKPQWTRPEDELEGSPMYGEREVGTDDYFRGSRVRTFEARSMEVTLVMSMPANPPSPPPPTPHPPTRPNPPPIMILVRSAQHFMIQFLIRTKIPARNSWFRATRERSSHISLSATLPPPSPTPTSPPS
jgi:hypothetical protein